MALETVDIDSRIAVAAVAEMLLAADTRCIRRIADVTVDAFHQAVLLGADATVHGLITLVKDVFHVVPAHVCSRFHTALGFTNAGLCCRDFRQQRVVRLSGHDYTQQQTRHQY
jgi:hypothetical protein